MTERPDVDGTRSLRPGGRSSRVRDAVLAATFDELADVGYSALSIASIARRAGVNKTSIYRRWHDRETLLADALDVVIVDPVAPRDNGSLDDDLKSYARDIVGRLTGRAGRALVALLTPETRSIPAVARARDELFATRRPLSAEIVRRAVARGELPDGTDADALIDHLVAPLYFRLLLSRERLDVAWADTAARAAASAARAGAFAQR